MSDNIEDLLRGAFNPHGKELDYLFDELKDALNDKKDNYACECADKIYALIFDTSMRYARFVSNVEQRFENEKNLKEADKEYIQRVINRAKTAYSKVNETLKEFQEYQQESDLTNAPKE